MKNSTILWIASVIIAACTAIAVLPEYDEDVKIIVGFFGGLLTLICSGTALPVVSEGKKELIVKVLKLLPGFLAKIYRLFKGKKYVYLTFALILMLSLTSCTKNYYDEALRKEVITEKDALILNSMLFAKDKNDQYVFTVNYIAGFYRLALLGQGKTDENDIARQIEEFKTKLKELRGE